MRATTTTMVVAAAATAAQSEESCGECVKSRAALERRGGQEVLDAVAMATLAHLSYAPWEDLSEGPAWFEVLGKTTSRALWVKEVLRWLGCVWSRPIPHPGTRTPRPLLATTTTTTGDSTMTGDSSATSSSFFVGGMSSSSRRCDGPMKRRWELAWWLWDWHEARASQWHSTNAAVAVRPSDGAIAVAFRGSADGKNAATNLQPLTRADPTTERRLPGRTLHGMRRAFASVDRGNVTAFRSTPRLLAADPDLAAIFRPLLLQSTKDEPGPLADMLEAIATNAVDGRRDVFLSGHSLGAALAVQLAARILPATDGRQRRTHLPVGSDDDPHVGQRRRKKRHLRLVTFGEPAFGDAAFYAAHRHLAPHARRYLSLSAPPLCAADVVAHIAAPFGAGQHLTPPTFVCDPRRPPGPITAHAMAAYVRGLRAATRHWLDLHVTVAPTLLPHLRSKVTVKVTD